MNKEIFEVSRKDYKNYLSELKSEAKEIHTFTEGMCEITEVFSKNTGNLLISRESWKNGEEKYYIYSLPEPEERLPSIPRYQLVLETPEEVQNFLNYIKEKK